MEKYQIEPDGDSFGVMRILPNGKHVLSAGF
jgi:hypothetical protein